MHAVTDARLWQLRTDSRKPLVAYVRERLSRQLAESGASATAVDEAMHLFDPNVLTLGFARRFATYKRPNLLLYDPERLLGLLTDSARPVQLILAGKAHPADHAGQAMITQWTRFIQRSEAQRHVVFLSDDDMHLTMHLVQGVDVWLNTPRRPWEASGTSGMKVLVNGGINVSELDGWWAEAWSPEVGWALGDGQEHGEDPSWDATEADALYDLLEHEVIPAFYTRDANGIPTAWVARMRESIARLTPQFSTNRVIREYTEQHYLPAAAAYRERAADGGAIGRQVADWRNTLREQWAALGIGQPVVETNGEQYIFAVQIFLADLDPEAVRVELYADGSGDGAPVRQEMRRVPPSDTYRAQVAATRAAEHYTVRVIPHHDGVAVPLEAAQILWHQ
jgi:starch phosphorylase